MAYDREAFLMYLAGFTSAFPPIVSSFEKLYLEDKERFYTAACRNSRHTNSFLNSGNLMNDVNCRRIFGVYLVAEEDELTHKRICDILLAFDKNFSVFLKKRSEENYKKLMANRIYTGSYHRVNFPLYALWYLLGLETGLEDDINFREHHDPNLCRERLEKIDPFAYLNIDQSDWKIMKQISSGRDIDTILCFPEIIMGFRREDEASNSSLLQAWKNDVEEHQEDGLWADMISVTHGLAAMIDYYGMSITQLFKDVEITKSERELILKALASINCQMSGKDHGDKQQVQTPLSVSLYYNAFLLYLLVKNLAETKKFYFDNNNETLFSQISVFREENERMKADLLEAKKKVKEEREHSQLLRKQIESLNQNASKDEKALLKPYLEEIALLKKRILELESNLEVEQSKAQELNALREFAFAAQSEYIPEDSDTDLADLIKGKKVVVIGGHIEWRNKLKKNHPTMIVMDGHNTGADLSVLYNADMVLLNVSNMSHSLYYKVVDILRNNKIPFDYLGRTVNQERYEKEIILLLQKHKL